MAKWKLADAARRFTAELNSLLNRTIASNVRLTSATLPIPGGGEAILIGNGISRHDLGARNPFELTVPDGSAPIAMEVHYSLSGDNEGKYLQVNSSVIAIQLMTARRGEPPTYEELLHVDYERDKPHGYPEAHIQVHARSDAWDQALPNRGLEKLHLPVGGRRYRPSLEDVIEFLIRERLAAPADRADGILERARAEVHKKQLRAAIRRDPETAREYLSTLDDGARDEN